MSRQLLKRIHTPILAGALFAAACGPAGASASPSASALTYPPITPTPGDAFEGYMWDLAGRGNPAASDLHTMWSQWASLPQGIRITAPRAVVPYGPGEVPPVACADGMPRDSWRGNASYCAADQTIAYDAAMVRSVYDDVGNGPDAASAILAHEWGHHVQALAGHGQYSIQDELEADCMAGAFAARRAVEAGNYDGETMQALGFIFSRGNKDYQRTRWFTGDEHGAPMQRTLAYMLGATAPYLSYEVCSGYGRWQPGDPVPIGGLQFTDLPGRPGSLEGDAYVIDEPDLPILRLEPFAVGKDPEFPSLVKDVLQQRFGRALVAQTEPQPYKASVVNGAIAWYGVNRDADVGDVEQHGDLGLFSFGPEPNQSLLITTVGRGALAIDAKRNATPEAKKRNLGVVQNTRMLELMALFRVCPDGGSGDGDSPNFVAACVTDESTLNP